MSFNVKEFKLLNFPNVIFVNFGLLLILIELILSLPSVLVCIVTLFKLSKLPIETFVKLLLFPNDKLVIFGTLFTMFVNVVFVNALILFKYNCLIDVDVISIVVNFVLLLKFKVSILLLPYAYNVSKFLHFDIKSNDDKLLFPIRKSFIVFGNVNELNIFSPFEFLCPETNNVSSFVNFETFKDDILLFVKFNVFKFVAVFKFSIDSNELLLAFKFVKFGRFAISKLCIFVSLISNEVKLLLPFIDNVHKNSLLLKSSVVKLFSDAYKRFNFVFPLKFSFVKLFLNIIKSVKTVLFLKFISVKLLLDILNFSKALF